MSLRATTLTWQLLMAICKKEKRTLVAQLEIILIEAAERHQVGPCK